MSRYAPAGDGSVAFVGESLTLIIERPAADELVITLTGAMHRDPDLAKLVRPWRDDLVAALKESA